ncbi:class III lanthipeptide [Stackebrandtia soli]
MSKILKLQKLAAQPTHVEPALSISSCDSHSC